MLTLLSKTTSSRGISWITKISAAEVNLVQKVLHEFIFAGPIGNNFLSKFKMSMWKKCYSAKEFPKNIVKIRTSFLSELIIVSFLREKFS